MNRLLSLFIVAHLYVAAAVGRDEVPFDTLLMQTARTVSKYMDDPARYEEAHRLLDATFAKEGVRRSPVYPLLRYHEAVYYVNMGDIDRAKTILTEALSMLPSRVDRELSISVPQTLGVLLRREGKNDSALYYYDMALQAANEQDNVEWQATIALNVGVLHYNLNQYEEAERYLDKTVQLMAQVDDEYTELCAHQVRGGVKMALHKYDEAEQSLQKAWQMSLKTQSADLQLRSLTPIMQLYSDTNRPDSASAAMKRGDALLQQMPAQSIAAIGYLCARANFNYQQQQWAPALADFLATRATYSGTGESKVLYRMAHCYAQLGRYHEAYCYMDSARMRSDTIASVRLAEKMADFNVKYQSMEKDLEIARLQSQRLWFVLIAAVVLLFVVGAWLYYRLHRQRREASLRIQALEDERKRIAKELHDGLCNDMLAMEMQMLFATSATPADWSAQLQQLRRQARQISHQLMPPEFSNVSIHLLLGYYAKALAEGTKLAVTYEATPSDSDHWQQMDAQKAHNVYRIVQELTANIVKGHTATRIAIRLAAVEATHCLLTVTDDGDMTRPVETGLGHRTLEDRVLSIGGHVQQQHEEGENRFELHFDY